MPRIGFCVIFEDKPLEKISEMIESMGFIKDQEISREGALVEYHYFWGKRQLHLRVFRLSESKETYGLRAHTEPSIKTNPQWHAERFLERLAGDLREKSNYGAGCRKFKAMLSRYKRSKASVNNSK